MKVNERIEHILKDYESDKDIKKAVLFYCSDMSTAWVCTIIKKIRAVQPQIFTEIEKKVSHLPVSKSRSIEKYITAYILDKLHPCPICGKLATENRITCSLQCQGKLESVKEKRKQTNLKKFGVENPFQDTERVKQGMLEKHGVEWVTQSKEVREKIEKTNFEKYGCKATSQSDIVKEVAEKTCLERYGTVSPMQNENVKAKVKQTLIEHFGDPKYVNVEKYRQTMIEKYGREYLNQNNIMNYDDLNEEFVRKNFIRDNLFYIDEFQLYFNLSRTASNAYRRRFNIEESNYHKRSRVETDLFNFIDTDIKYLDDRELIQPYELDIVVPDYKLAIEYDGTHWHTDHEKDYHLNKTLKCSEKGYQLFHIFDFEDIEIWKSMINNKLGLNKKIYARKCVIKEIDHITAKVFCEQNHLQGYVNSSIRLGLYHENELVQVMTFGKPRFNKEYDYELLRLCSLKGVNVVGGASKLFCYFRDEFWGTVISYANLRYSNGLVYEKMGFKLIDRTPPSYYWVRYRSVLSRFQCQKHKLKEFKNYSDDKTETQIMLENKYNKIYDCGNLVYVFE